MIDFTLSRSARKALPDTITVNGEAFSVCTDFRVILKIMRLQNDPDVLDIDKQEKTREWFFEHPDDAPDDWGDAFLNFIRAGDELTPPTGGRDFDYEFDAPEIYASFMQLYRINLFEANMHWWKFQALLTGCFSCECALSRKIRLRNIDPGKCEDKATAQRAKEAVQIPLSIGADEMLITRELSERLMRGEPIEDLLR